MPNIFQEVRVMQEEGKIHSKLIKSLRIMGAIAFILLGIVVYELIFQGVDPLISAGLAMIGFLLGFYLFSPVNATVWDEEKEVVMARRMDVLGFAAIAVYIVIVVGLRIYLAQHFPASSTIFALALVFGMLAGRVTGTINEIHRTFRAAHVT